MNMLRRDFLKLCGATAAALGVEITPFGAIDRVLAASKHAPTYPISSTVLTTLERTVIPVGDPQGMYPQPPYATIFPSDIALYKENGYGLWKYGAAFPYSAIDIQTGEVTPSSIPDPKAVKLVSFFAMSDVHLCDKESPARAIYAGYQYPYPTLPPSPTPVRPPGPITQRSVGDSSTYSGVILYTTQVLDAAVQTINALHKTKPFDFGICLGDVADNNQYNETRWFVDVLDGKWITPSSGAHLGAGSIDYQKPYQAAGLNKSIPWYQAVGNHDQFWMGSTLVTDYIRKCLIGSRVMRTGAITEMPQNWQKVFAGRNTYAGVVDGSTPYGTVKYAGPVRDIHGPATVAADPGRRSLSINYWISQFFNTTTDPIGHGFTQKGAIDGFACYSFNPDPGIPIKIVVLDDTNKVLGNPKGALDRQRLNWLISELEAGQEADELMIICAHIPVCPYGYPTVWDKTSVISDRNIVKEINAKYGNVIMWVAGHMHRNTITPKPANRSAGPGDPDYGHGFWMVETPSLRDYPQQFRRFEVVRNSDDRTLSILVYSVDHASGKLADGTPSPSLKSRTSAVAAQQIFGHPWKQGPGMDPKPSSSDLNAQLKVPLSQLTPGLRTKLRNI